MKAVTALIPQQDQIALFEDLKGIIAGYDIAWLSQESGVGRSTLYFWLEGRTRKPRLDTIAKVAQTLGYELRLIKMAGRQKARLRLV